LVPHLAPHLAPHHALRHLIQIVIQIVRIVIRIVNQIVIQTSIREATLAMKQTNTRKKRKTCVAKTVFGKNAEEERGMTQAQTQAPTQAPTQAQTQTQTQTPAPAQTRVWAKLKATSMEATSKAMPQNKTGRALEKYEFEAEDERPNGPFRACVCALKIFDLLLVHFRRRSPDTYRRNHPETEEFSCTDHKLKRRVGGCVSRVSRKSASKIETCAQFRLAQRLQQLNDTTPIVGRASVRAVLEDDN
jgi:hypothetical protein